MNQRPRTIEEQVSLLRAKGMEFEDLSRAKALLARISYFRLKYFWTDLMDEFTDDGFLPNTSLFEDTDRHQEFVLNLKYEFERSTEPFAKKYIENHPNWQGDSFEGDNPDAWMIIEVATFGTLSKMYKNLKNQLPQKSAIANDF